MEKSLTFTVIVHFTSKLFKPFCLQITLHVHDVAMKLLEWFYCTT